MYYYFWYGCGEDYDSATFELYDTNDLNTKLNDWIKPDRGDLKWDGTDSDAADFNARLKVKNSAGNENFHDFTVDVLTFNSACVYTAAQTSH